MTRNLGLDGLRGVAVLMVLLDHHALMNMGWMGVDIFFVLSGYLITSILRAARRESAFWQEFWTKRVTRILPPVIFLMLLAAVLGFCPSKGQFFGYFLSLGDYLVYLHPGNKVLGITWSLAVEEHFYLVWPIAVRYLERKNLVRLLLAVLILEPLLRAVVSIHQASYDLVYYTTPFRLDGLAAGSLLAIAMESEATRSLVVRCCRPVALASVIAFLAFRFGLGREFSREAAHSLLYNTFVYSLIAWAAAGLIAYLVTNNSSWSVKLLSNRFLVFMGGISYGVYLYQNIVQKLISQVLPMPVRSALLIDFPLTVAISWLSFKYLEKPIMSWGKQRIRAARSKQGMLLST